MDKIIIHHQGRCLYANITSPSAPIAIADINAIITVAEQAVMFIWGNNRQDFINYVGIRLISTKYSYLRDGHVLSAAFAAFRLVRSAVRYLPTVLIYVEHYITVIYAGHDTTIIYAGRDSLLSDLSYFAGLGLISHSWSLSERPLAANSSLFRNSRLTTYCLLAYGVCYDAVVVPLCTTLNLSALRRF